MAGRKAFAALVAAGLGTLAPAAWADTANPAPQSPEATTIVPQVLGNQKHADPWQPLIDRGIRLALNYTGEAAANPVGGDRQDAAYAGQVYMGVDLDMGKLAGIHGAGLHFAVTNRHGDNLAQTALGNNTSVQEIWGTQNTHLAILTWEQSFLNDHLTIEAGKSQANIHFLTSPLYCNFQSNSACGNPTLVFKDSNFTYFPASSWMAKARVQFDRHWFAHAGIYEVNPNRKRATDDGFSLSFKGGTGFIVPFEVGYGSDAKTDRLPRHYILGGWVDRGTYADPISDAAGGIALLTGSAPATHKGRAGLYVRFDQMLTRPDPKSDRGLTLFGVAMANVSGRVEESHYFELGLVQTGTFHGRDRDTLGFMINDQHFSDLAVSRMSAGQIAGGGTGRVHRDEIMMELAYGLQLGDALRLSPNVQYIVHPDQSGVPFRATNVPDALVFGFKFTVDAMKLIPR